MESSEGFNLEARETGFDYLTNLHRHKCFGYLGMTYISGADDITNAGAGNCFFPGGTGTCTGLTAIAASDANAEALHSGISAAQTALSAYTSAILDFTSIDPTDVDLTQ